VFQRKDGRWCGMLSLGWENGKRKRKSYFAQTAAEVRDQLLKARSDHARGLPVAIERQTVAQYIDHWLEHTLKAKAKPRSHERFSTIARLHIKPSLGRIQLHKLAPQHIQKLLDEKSKAGLSPQTVTNIRTVLRSALTQATKWNLVSRNSAALVTHCLPPRLAEAIDALDDRSDVTHLSQKFPRNLPDAKWISELGREGGWVIVSGDLRISRNKAERQAWLESGLTAFFLAGAWGQQKLWLTAWKLIKWWPLIVAQAESIRPGAGFIVPVSGDKIQQLQLR
jgi:hypothetical protein